MSDESELWRTLSMIHLSPYLQCPACRKVVFDPDRKLARRDLPTPCCGTSGQARLLWPSAETYDILEIARRQKLGTSHGRRVAVVFLASAFEMLLESVLLELLATHGSSTALSEVILDGYQGRERRMVLFRVLAGSSISDVLKAKGLGDFYTDWTEIAKARNTIVHEYAYERKSDPQILIKRAIEKCFEAFAELHNYAVSVNLKEITPDRATQQG